MPLLELFTILLTLGSIGVIAAPVDSATTKACSDIDVAIPGRLSYPYSWAYYYETDNYWSQAMKDARPACVAMPTSATEVSAVVKILNTYPEVRYAVKSGGHSPNVGFAAVDGGVLLSLANMKGAKYDAAKGVAYVGPGGKWKDVILDLEPLKKTVVGGRLDVVGVGGYLTGGGLSFLSAQHGMAADSVTNFETVMANGSIVNVNAQTAPDLLVAMRGGGNQFGIVTNFTMKAFDIGTDGQVWGGPVVFSDSNRDALIEAFQDFTENPVDPKAAIILEFTRLGGSGVWLLHTFYDGAQPAPGAFKGFEKIENIPGLDSRKTRPYSDLLWVNGFGSHALAYGRMKFRMMTQPLLPGNFGVEAIKKAVSMWQSELQSYQYVNGAAIGAFAMQSFPSLIGKATSRAGGNAMGLGASDGPRWMVELSTIHTGAANDAPMDEAMRSVVERISFDLNARLDSWRTTGNATAMSKVESYNPLFMNDAAADQDVYSTYRDFAKFRELQRQVDPQGFWRRTGGFKFKQ